MNNTLLPGSSVIPETNEYPLTTIFYKQDTVSNPRFCRTNWRNTQFLSLFLAKIRGKAIPQFSEILELSHYAKLQLEESWTSSWEVSPCCCTLSLFIYSPHKQGSQPITLLAEGQTLFPFLFYLFILKFILLEIYLTPWICELYLSTLLKNLSLFSSDMASVTFYFSHILFSMLLYLSFMFSICLYFLDAVWIFLLIYIPTY